MRKLITPLILVLLLNVVACRKAATTNPEEQAVKQALENYLMQKKGLNLKGMKVDYKNLQIAGDQATLDAMFQSGTASDMTIGFRYTLKKSANGWEVVKSEPTSGSMFGGHAAGGQPGTAASGEGALPPGHPVVPPSSGGQTSSGMEAAHGKEAPEKK